MNPVPRATRVLAVALATASVAACSESERNPIDPNPPTQSISVSVSPRRDTVEVGRTTQLSARVVDQNNAPVARAVEWRSVDPSIATVSPAGLVTGVGLGNVRIVASAGAAADTAALFISPGSAALAVVPGAASAFIGDQLQLTVQAASGTTAAAVENVTWVSSNPTVATISSSGLVTTQGEGNAILTAQVGTQSASAVIKVTETDAVSISITPTNSSIYPGNEVPLTALVQDDNNRALHRKPTWTTSNAAIATVSDNGVVKGVAQGTAIITAKIENKRATATINVLAKPVARVTVSLPTETLGIGQATTASVTLVDESGAPATDKPVAWQSSNPALATVTSAGVVTGIAAGSVTVSAISDGKIGSAPLKVASATLAAIAITPSAPSAIAGQSAQLVAVGRDAAGATLPSRPMTWASSNTSVATVSATGLVSTLAVGTTTISASADGITGTTTFTVTSVPVTSVSVSQTQVQLSVGAAAQVTATALGADGTALPSRPVSWTSANPTVATVSSSGTITGISKGSTTVTATIEGISAPVAVGVAEPPPSPVASIAVALAPSQVTVGQASQATATLRDAGGTVLSGRTITWSSTDATLATVSSSGAITTVGAGTVTITASSEGKTGAATLTVAAPAPAPVATVNLSLSASSINVGQTAQATVTLLGSNGQQLTGRTIAWSSSNPAVAIVNSSGQVTGVSAGTASIRATSEGKTGSAPITVTSTTPTPAPVATVAVLLGSSSLTTGQTTQATATLRDASGNVLGGRLVSWTSSNPTVASVSSTGAVNALTAGSVQIIATSEGKTGSAGLTVTAPVTQPPPPPPANFVESILGPMVSSSSVKALGGAFSQYETDFVTYDELEWADCGPSWSCINYYDRASIYFVRYVRTGDSKYLDRAKATALDYRKNYLEANNYGLAHYWSMMEGVGLHYLATGDQASLVAVGKVADNFAYHTPKLTQWLYLDNRFQAYWMRAVLLAWQLKAPSTGISATGIPGGNDWAAHLKQGLTNILASRDLGQAANIQGRSDWPAGTKRATDGLWRAAQCGMENGYVNRVHPFQIGLLLDAMIRYYEQFEADPRIPAVVKAHVDYMWANDWVDSRQGFVYVEPNCPAEGGSTGSPDLNNLIVNAYSWVYRQTGDAGYKLKADQIFAGSVNAHGVTAGPKQFNQQYTMSYRYLNQRR